MSDYSFKRNEHLKSRKRIGQLFSEGKSSKAFPLRAQFDYVNKGESDVFINAGFVVPKKKLRKAVDRNRVKRQMIEAFRLQREDLMNKLQKHSLHGDVMFIYLGDRIPVYSKLEKNMIKLLDKLIKEIENKYSLESDS